MSPSLVSSEVDPVSQPTPAAGPEEAARPADPRASEAPASSPSNLPVERVPGFREKFLYYAGIALILLGGPGMALGSWLHDVLRISFLGYTSFDVFGPVNRLVVGLGLVVMAAGIVFLVLSLRLSRPAGPGSTA